MLLGCIGDDFTGSSDLGNTLTRAGMRTVQYVGVPGAAAAPDVEAGIVALKSRSIPVGEAVRLSLQALEWLRAQGCRQFLFKYCSTFDSTPQGNIGPVAEALAEALGARQVLVCPAFPGAGRTIYQGHLFVGDRLLNESGMENHPLTPMTDADIRRWLALQATGSVGHVPASAVFAGAQAVADRLAAEDAAGHRLIVADAIRDEDLVTLGRAAAGLPLLTGGSGIAMGLPGNFRDEGLLAGGASAWRGQAGRAAVLSGSCSNATRAQVARHRQNNPALEITAEAVMSGAMTGEKVARWLLAQDGLPLAYSSADPQEVARAQQTYGTEAIAHRLEALFAEAARHLVAGGVARLITAGGETSGAVVEGLALEHLRIGPEIDPGVPAMRAHDGLVLALKSGNFGAEDFFEKAAKRLAEDQE
ncbi:3-oxo-tetronate kinase [Actibacterium sp. MT2.3-13A]|uniref:3-oxo-tetronate kinase n=1 Tax=Actibacterium sp. MT2.3-13A TaxID=2828332 RepID=UPI001BA63F2E|nr:3-oxo-tetronate kinase [Actibacterium sp. MT2.3-13A]